MTETIAHHAIHELLTRRSDLRALAGDFDKAMGLLLSCVRAGGTILACGNGGSASDAQHIVGELLKGFRSKRPLSSTERESIHRHFPNEADGIASKLQGAIPAISLVGEAALITAVANDTDPDYIFAQQVWGLGRAGDLLIAISTSGNSKNVLAAAKVAKARGMKILALSGRTGGKLKELSDVVLCAPYDDVALIQECHLPIYHALCTDLEAVLFESASDNQTRMRGWPERIELVVFDFDGVFTDNKVYTLQDGSESVLCDRRDGLGVDMLHERGVPMMILSKETNPVVAARARKLKLEVHGSCDDKATFLARYLNDRKIDPKHVAYLGNDLNDLESMRLVGFPVAPADSHPQILAEAALVLSRDGGDGAVREFAEALISQLEGN